MGRVRKWGDREQRIQKERTLVLSSRSTERNQLFFFLGVVVVVVLFSQYQFLPLYYKTVPPLYDLNGNRRV